MPHRPRLATRLVTLLALLVLPLSAFGVVAPEKNAAMGKLVYFHPDLALPSQATPLDRIPAALAGRLREELRRLAGSDGSGVRAFSADPTRVPPALYDLRAGRWDTLVLSHPLIPGPGVGNDLTWSGIRLASPLGSADVERAAAKEFVAFLGAHHAELGIDAGELAPANVAVGENGRLIQIYAQRQIGGVPVRNSYVQGVVNSGNLVLFGSRNWGKVDVSTQPSLSAPDASTAIEKYVESSGKVAGISGWWRDPHLTIVPTALGEGYHFRLAWVVSPTLVGDLGAWEALVDAHSGELLAFSDQNEYITRRVVGGIYPISNDGLSTNGVPDGIEQPGHPMPFAEIAGTVPPAYTNSAGLVDFSGPFATTLSGKFVKMNDLCGPTSEEADSCTSLSLSQGTGTDCVVPVGHSAGDTHASRTGFYEVNRIIEQAKGWVPATSIPNNPGGWLNRQLTSNMNIVSTCNAFWTPAGGTINFYREGPHSSGTIICRNTGEIAAVFDHEWGHGLDNNDNIPDVSVPGEAYADIAALLRLNTSCIGRGFLKSLGDGSQENQVFCGGFGDACTSCSGVREIDWMKHASGNPHDIDWVLGLNPDASGGCTEPDVIPIPTGQGTGPCGWGTHCEGMIVGEAIWDLLKRDLPCNGIGWENVAGGRCTGGAAPTIDFNTSLELVARLFYLAGGGVNQWYSCNPLAAQGENEFGGRLTDSGYMQFLAADDDNGLLLDGTPHMKAIYDAFNRHNIASDLVPVVTAGCTAKPAHAPSNVRASATVNGANVSWNPVPGAEKYWVFRTEGVHGCSFGKVKIGETTATSFSETGLLDGFRYFYSVVPVGNGVLPGEDACAGLMSECAQVVPLSPAPPPATASLRFEAIPGSLTVSGGDGDAYLDNCENGTLSFHVFSEGSGPLTNVRIIAANSTSHPQTTVTSPIPSVFAPSIAAGCGLPEASAVGTIGFNAQGLANGDTLTFNVTVTADQLGAPVSGTISATNVETSIGLVPSVTFDFESGTQDWVVAGGTFERTNVPPPTPPGSGSYMKSSGAAPLGPACDEIRSPKIILTADSTLSLANQFVTEPDSQGHWYDRANVGIIVDGTSTRTVVDPDGGRSYNASAGNPENTSLCTNLQNGWAGTGAWDSSSWSAAALGSAGLDGTPVRISVIYGTDPTASLAGFNFDQVTLTNVHYLAPDAQSNECAPPPKPDLFVESISGGNNKAREGDKVTITATIRNQGSAAAGVSTTRFRLDGTTVLGTPSTGSIPAGGSASVSVQWDTRSVKGPHVIEATADAANAVVESNEGNNTATLNVTVQGNKVTNGSFEQQNASGSGPEAWSGSSTGAGSATWSDGGSDGAKSAAASGNGGNAAASGSPSWTSDPIAVVPGEVLTLAVSVQSQAASSAASAGLVYLGAAGNVLQTVNLITAPLTTSGFAKLQQTVTIPAGVAQVRVKLSGFAPTDLRTSGTVKFDEVGLFGN